MVLGLRLLGKGLSAGASAVACVAKGVAWVAVGTVVNVGRVALSAKNTVTGGHKAESCVEDTKLVSNGESPLALALTPAKHDAEGEALGAPESTEQLGGEGCSVTKARLSVSEKGCVESCNQEQQEQQESLLRTASEGVISDEVRSDIMGGAAIAARFSVEHEVELMAYSAVLDIVTGAGEGSKDQVQARETLEEWMREREEGIVDEEVETKFEGSMIEIWNQVLQQIEWYTFKRPPCSEWWWARNLLSVCQLGCNKRGIPEIWVLQIAQQTARDLMLCHELGICYFNVNPDGILLMQLPDCEEDDLVEGKVVLGDFRHAERMGDLGGVTEPIGDWKYMAPEMKALLGNESARAAAPIGPACDMYALGMTIYFLLGGKEEGSVLCDEATKEIAELMLAKDPSQRITAAEALQLLNDHPLLS